MNGLMNKKLFECVCATVIVVGVLALVQACTQPPSDTPARDFNLVKLFTVDGCSVYRFYDTANHYIVICPQGQQINSQLGGKAKHDDTISTVYARRPMRPM